MSKADGKCNRCKGTGFRDTPVFHLGVPGLCYGCDGAGTYEAYVAKKAATKLAKIQNDAFDAAYRFVNDIAEKNGGRLTLDREGRRLVRSMTSPFTSHDYAVMRGIDDKAAFIELCRIGRHIVCPVIGPDLKPVGWTNE